MPGMGGVELAHVARERWPDIPILLTSGFSHTLANDAAHGFDILRKPYAMNELSLSLQEKLG